MSNDLERLDDAGLGAGIDAALDRVLDPCSSAAGLPATLREMGLVDRVGITPGATGARVAIRLGVTHPSCFMAPIFLRQVEEQVAAVEGVAEVEVTLDAHFDWMPEDMDAGYRQRLSDHRLAQYGARTPSDLPGAS